MFSAIKRLLNAPIPPVVRPETGTSILTPPGGRPAPISQRTQPFATAPAVPVPSPRSIAVLTPSNTTATYVPSAAGTDLHETKLLRERPTGRRAVLTNTTTESRRQPARTCALTC